MYKDWISRKEEEEIPQFDSHKEAKEYFSAKYGKDFILTSIEKIDGQKCYFYYLIVNWENYRRLQNAMAKRETGNLDSVLIESAQPIQIMEDGSVHIVH